MPWATIWTSQKIGAPARSAVDASALKPGVNAMSSASVDHAAGRDDRHRDLFLAGLETAKPRLGADDGERAPVDCRAVGFVSIAHAVPASEGVDAIASIALLRRVVQ